MADQSMLGIGQFSPDLIAMGKDALESGEVTPQDVIGIAKNSGLLDHLISGGQKPPFSFGEANLPAMTKKVGKGQMEKGEAKNVTDTKTSQTKNLNYSPEEFLNLSDSVNQLPDVQAQREGIQKMQDLFDMQAGQNPADNEWLAKPLIALSDSLTGSKLMAGYTPGQTQADRNKALLKYQEDIQAKKGDLSKTILEGIQKMKAGTQTDAQNQQILQQLAYQNGMLGNGALANTRQNKMISDAGAAFTNDKYLGQMMNTKNNLDRAVSMIEGKTPVTAKNFAILQMDMINAMAPGGAATEGKVNREMVETLSTKLNEIQQKGGNIQDLRKQDPALFAQLKQLITQIHGDYDHALADRTEDIAARFKFVPDDAVQNTVAEMKDRYLKKTRSYDEREAARKGTSGAPSAQVPKVGDVVDGMKFLGGDPSKPTSWGA